MTDFDFDHYTPPTPAPRMLARIKRRARRQTFVRAAAVVLIGAAGFLLTRSPAPLSPAPGGSYPVVLDVSRDNRPVPYTLLKLQSGNTVIIIPLDQENKS